MNKERIASELVRIAKELIINRQRSAAKKVKVGKRWFELDDSVGNLDMYWNIGKYEGMLYIEVGIKKKTGTVGTSISSGFDDWAYDMPKKAGYKDGLEDEALDDDKTYDKVIGKATKDLLKGVKNDAKKVWKGYKIAFFGGYAQSR